MAKKSKKKIEEKQSDFIYFEWERLKRMQGYREAWKRYWELDGQSEDLMYDAYYNSDGEMLINIEGVQRWEAVEKEKAEILKRYRVNYMPNPDNTDDLGVMRNHNKTVLLKRAIKDSVFVDGGEKLSTEVPVMFEVNIWKDKEEVFLELSNWIDEERAKKKKQQEGPSWINAKVMARRMKVYDLRDLRPPMQYRKIANELADLYGKTKDPDKAVNLARCDYSDVFEFIHGVSYTAYDKPDTLDDKLFPCNTCSAKKTCKELCASAEQYLLPIQVKRKEYINNRTDAAEFFTGKVDPQVFTDREF